MDRKEVLEALKSIRGNSKKRNFTESVDLIINLKGLNIKREEERINAFVPVPHDRGKKTRISALIGDALSTKAKGICDNIILETDFKKLDKKSIKNIAEKTDFFIAQADIMPKVAASFGRVLGPRGMMPNPKAGCVIPPTAELKPLVEKLQKTVRIETKNEQVIKARVGLASMEDDKLVDNILAIYNHIIHHVPQEKNNIKDVLMKLSMGKPVVVGSKKGTGVKK